jgi:orotate phosphoribosyltransferase
LDGDVTLSSRTSSSYYYDVKRALLAPKLKIDLAEAMLDLVSDLEYDIVGGLAVGSVPIAEQMSVVSELKRGQPFGTFYVRSQPKEHGTAEQTFQAYDDSIHPMLVPGARVLVVDDVVTTGKSMEIVFDQIWKAQATIVAVAVIVDRCDPAADSIRHHPRFSYRSLFEADPDGYIVPRRAPAVA